MRFALVVFAVVFSLACGNAQSNPSTASSQSSQAQPAYGLIQAQHADCQTNGNNLAAYLDTGQPTSNDAVWGNRRQDVLNLSGEKRDLYIRQVVDAYITECDQKKSAQEAAIAKQQADAQAAAQKAAQDAQISSKEETKCAQVGGTWSKGIFGGGCQVKYRSVNDGHDYDYALAFDDNGNLTPVATKQDCLSRGIPSQPVTLWTWHEDTQICSYK